MKKWLLFIFFICLLACNNQWFDFIEPEEEKEENTQKPNPPVVVVDSTQVIISDTIAVSF